MRKYDLGYIAPIRKLWGPLLRSLNRVLKRDYDECAQAWTGTIASTIVHSWNAAIVKARSERRAAARADRRCVHCNEPITAQRSTGKFYSVRCRVAAHRHVSRRRSKPPEPPPKPARARALVSEQLKHSPGLESLVTAAAEAADIPQCTLVVAADALGVRMQKGQWWLLVPAALDVDAEIALAATSQIET